MEKSLIDSFLDQIEWNSENFKNPFQIHQHVQTVLQLDIIFELDFLESIKQECLHKMEEQFLGLSMEIDSKITVIITNNK